MNFSHTKRCIFYFFLFALLILALFPKQMVLAATSWKIRHLCKEIFAAELNFERLIWEKNEIHFIKGTLQRKGELDVTFDQATLVPFLSIKKRSFGGTLSFKNFKIAHAATGFKTSSKSISPFFKVFKLRLDTTIENGEIMLYDALSKTCHSQHAFYLKHYVFDNQMIGNISLALTPQHPALDIKYTLQRDLVDLKTHFYSQSFPELAHFISTYFLKDPPKEIFQWQSNEGIVDGDLEMTLIKGMPIKMKGNLCLKGVHSCNSHYKVITEVDQLKCALDIDFTKVSAMNASFNLEGGRVAWISPAITEKIASRDGLWDLKNLYSNISIKEGNVESSSLKGSFMGMEGEMSLDWHSNDLLMKAVCSGSSKMMRIALPEKLQTPFFSAFPDDLFSLEASLKRSTQGGLELNGILFINENEYQTYEVSFGCLLGSCDKEIEIVDSSQHLNFNACSPSKWVTPFLENLKQQFCLSQKRFGWFQGKDFPLHKFLSPFLLNKTPMELYGLADFRATFDERYLIVFYEGKKIELQSPHFCFETEVIQEHCGITAVHYFDLQTWNHVGFLPLRRAHYWQKNYDFHLDDIDAVINFENNLIKIQDINTHGDGISFQGEVGLVIRSLEDIELNITIDQFKGGASNAQKFLTHFKDSTIWKIPVEGEVVGSVEPIFFKYHFSPSAKLKEGKVNGTIDLTFSNPLFSVHHYRARVEYNCLQNELWIRDGKGSLQLNCRENFLDFETSFVKMREFLDPLIDFNLSLSDKEGLILNADLSSSKSEEGKEIVLAVKEPKTSETIVCTLIQKGDYFNIPEFVCGRWRFCSAMQLAEHGIYVHNLTCFVGEKIGVCLSGEYDLHKKIFNGFFNVKNCDWLNEALARISHTFSSKCEKSGLEGSFSVDVSPGTIKVDLSLSNGIYPISNLDMSLNNFQVCFNRTELKVWSQFLYQDNYYWLHFSSDSLSLNSGKLAISERELSNENQEIYEALVAEWGRTDEQRWRIFSLKGIFCGMDVSLTNKEPNRFKNCVFDLSGHVGFDGSKLQSIINSQLKKQLESFSLAGCFTLEGDLALNKLPLSNLTFKGHASGTNCAIKEIAFNTFSTELECSQDRIQITHFELKDWAGRLFANNLSFFRDDRNQWQCTLDLLLLSDFRFSRLKSPWTQWKPGEKSFFRSLFIPCFILENISANFAKINSISGTGRLEFSNLPRKTFFSNLLYLPTEITARIGLDLTTLVPARGTIFYTIDDGKILFTKFKDMYSEGKHSRFYLAEKSKAYIDFEGNLNMKIKMKQYTLFMKLAEFFTISIEGTLLNPSYSYTLNNHIVNEVSP